MNHVYKVIWSNAKSCYIVVSELAKNRSKNTVKVLSTLLAILGLGCSTFMDYNLLQKVDAAPITEKYQVETGKVENDTGKNDEGEDITSKGAMAIGKDSSVTRLDPEAPVSSTNNANESMAIGNGAIVQGQGSMAIGTGASVIANTALALGIESQVTGSNGLALGNKTTAGEGSIAIGNGGQVISQNHGIAIGMSSKSYSMNGIAIGLLSQTTDTYKDDNRNAGAIAIGSQARALGDVSIALGQNSEVSKNVAQSIAIGPSTKVSGDYAVALGLSSEVSGDYGIAIGHISSIAAEQGIAIGRDSHVKTGATNGLAIGVLSNVHERAEQGTAIGYYTNVYATYGTAVGSSANVAAAAKKGIALGYNTKVNASNGTAVGSDAIVNGSFSTAMGYNSQTSGEQSLAIGGNQAIANADKSIAVGSSANVDAAATEGIALGYKTKVNAKNATAVGSWANVAAGAQSGIAMGYNTKVNASNGTAVGSEANVNGSFSTAMGYNSQTFGQQSLAIGGYQAIANADKSIAVGSSANVDAAATEGIALGYKADTDANNSIAIGSEAATDSAAGWSTAIGNKSQTSGQQSLAIGGYQAVANAKYSTAVGSYTNVAADAEQGLAMGYKTKVNAGNGTAVGSWANVAATATNGIAMGYNTQVNAEYGTAVGSLANVAAGATQGMAMGFNTQVNAKNGTAVGSWANVAADADFGAAMGYNTKVNVEQGVALGSSSVANVAKGVTGWSPEALSEAEQKSSTWTSTAGAVSVGDSDNGITRQITNVAAGTEDTDAVNVAQLKQAITSSVDDVALSFKGDDGTEIEKKNGETLEIVGGAQGNLTDDNIGVVEKDGKLNIKLAKDIDLGPSGSMIIGNSIMNNNGITINSGSGGSPIIINQGNVSMGGNVIHDVAPGVADTDAVNVSQLKDYVSSNTSLSFKGDAGDAIKKNGGETLEIVGGAQGALTEGNIGVVEENGKLNIKLSQDIDLGKDGSISIGDISIENNNVSMGGNVIHNVAAGVADTDAVNVSQLKELESKVSAHNTVSTGDKNLTINETKNNDGGTNYDLALNPDLVVDSVTTGDTVMNDDGLTVGNDISITENNVTVGDVKIDVDNGIDAGDHKITNVSDGEISSDSKDAVNGSQLYATNQKIDNITQNVNNISNRVNKLDGRINKVGAGAAALAGLHPLDFDPDEKLTFSAGIGHYRGETAGAIGAFYRPDEKVMFSIGGTVGNGENMVNAGVSFALDRVSHVNDSKVAMAKEIIDLRSQVAELSQLVNQLAVQRGILTDATKLFPDVPENHWAYEYIGKLAAAGIIEGYPNGRFDGDRMMTRYEFAAMLYRALEKGVQLDARIVKEFAAELGRIRVDRISGEDDEEDKVERVRVNFDDKPRDHYGSEIPAPEQE